MIFVIQQLFIFTDTWLLSTSSIHVLTQSITTSSAFSSQIVQ